MELNDILIKQLTTYLTLLENDLEIKYAVDNTHAGNILSSLLERLSLLSPRIHLTLDNSYTPPSFSIAKIGEQHQITFFGAPLGHEFNSLVLALLQVSGRKPKLEEKEISDIAKIKTILNFTTYIGLTCSKCPDVVQAINSISVLNRNVTHQVIDIAVFTEEAKEKDIVATPTIYLNDKLFATGRLELSSILEKLL